MKFDFFKKFLLIAAIAGATNSVMAADMCNQISGQWAGTARCNGCTTSNVKSTITVVNSQMTMILSNTLGSQVGTCQNNTIALTGKGGQTPNMTYTGTITPDGKKIAINWQGLYGTGTISLSRA